ncbi:MAG: metal-dependent transcriptional regulator [Planctomycetes bacterium]|nr:metal-dependent transcriptional regulator [Planctomycetota bacterium]
MKKKVRDEILELVWVKKENKDMSGQQSLDEDELKLSSELVQTMVEGGYLCLQNGQVDFTEKGLSSATNLMRAHRLSERLFSDVLELGDQYLERNACTFEHILSPEVVESICILLSHPVECPHGRPIPPGRCCKSLTKEVPRVVVPLSDLPSGTFGKIVYVATKYHQRLDQLTALSITPGTVIKVHQTNPAYVIKVGETDVALDDQVVKDIYVRRE